MFLFLLLIGLGLSAFLVYLRGKYNEMYWTKRGVRFHGKNKFMGIFWDFITQNRPLFQICHDLYLQYPKERVVAFGSFFTPSLYIRDKNNVQFIMQSTSIIDRGVDYNDGDQLADNVLFMSGIRWKLMRQKMTPLFTPSKLKNMYYIMDKSARDFVEYLEKYPEKRKGNSFDTLTTFCCAAIGGAVFGIGSKSTFESPFLECTRGAFYPTFWSNIKFSLANLSPGLFKLFKLKFFSEYENFFIGAMKQVFRQREQEGNKKHDFADICLSIQKSGDIKHDESGFKMAPTDELLAAQGFFFFTAGVEPAATGVFGALIEMGRHPEIQKKVQEEIDSVFEKYQDNLTADAVGEMEYLEKVLSESLRVHPPIGFLTRRCIEDTVLPEGNIRIEKGTRVYTPIYEFHHDPEYFKNPEVFDPERFTDEAKQEMGVTYQPFGYGHRACIGARYAKLQVKSGLAHILRNFDIKTIIHEGGIKYGKDQVQLRMKNVDVEYIPRKVKSS
uniref:unspecific monooxygenase n=1 Tax=Ostrinia furnacalis TaxID=93504 RepID=A0A7S9CEH1_OSTFU|nr:cytochrome P450 monooxygenase CYP321F7 [Ostrinia furnacalis]